MAYITARELKAVVPDKYRDAALADEGSQPDAGLLSAVIEAAEREVDALIEGRVRLPLSTVPQKLKTAALYIALEILFIRRAVDIPEAIAAKIKWWRDWLSKVGAGEMRLEASTDEEVEATEEGAIVTLPNITGGTGLISALLFLFCLFCQPARAIEPRTFRFTASNTNTIDAPDYAEWSQGESFKLIYDLAAANTDDGREVRFEVSDATNLWVNAVPARSARTWTWTLAPTQTCLPAGSYGGRVAIYTRSGTNLTFHRVLAWQDLRVHAARDPRTLVLASPLDTLAEQDPVALGQIAGIWTFSSNTAAIAEAASNTAAEAVDAADLAAEAAAAAAASVSGAVENAWMKGDVVTGAVDETALATAQYASNTANSALLRTTGGTVTGSVRATEAFDVGAAVPPDDITGLDWKPAFYSTKREGDNGAGPIVIRQNASADYDNGITALGYGILGWGGRASLWLGSQDTADGTNMHENSTCIYFGRGPEIAASNSMWTISSRYQTRSDGHDAGRRFSIFQGGGNGSLLKADARFSILPDGGTVIARSWNSPDPVESSVLTVQSEGNADLWLRTATNAGTMNWARFFMGSGTNSILFLYGDGQRRFGIYPAWLNNFVFEITNSGAVTIDRLGKGTTLGGALEVAGNLTVGGAGVVLTNSPTYTDTVAKAALLTGARSDFLADTDNDQILHLGRQDEQIGVLRLQRVDSGYAELAADQDDQGLVYRDASTTNALFMFDVRGEKYFPTWSGGINGDGVSTLNGTVTVAAIKFTVGTNIYLVKPDPATSNLVFIANGSETPSMTIRTNGYVGIWGNGHPTYPLYVNGLSYYASTLRAPVFRDLSGNEVDPNDDSTLCDLAVTNTLTLDNLPTSTNGLSRGRIWNESGTLKVMP